MDIKLKAEIKASPVKKTENPEAKEITSFDIDPIVTQDSNLPKKEPYLIKKALENHKPSTEQLVGPAIKRFEKVTVKELATENLPCAKFYERSYMHKDVINHIIVSSISEHIITCSTDGNVKFWKKVFHLIEFVRQFKAHKGMINGACLDISHHK